GVGVGLHIAGDGAHRSPAATALSRDDRATQPRGLSSVSQAHRVFCDSVCELLACLWHSMVARRECARTRRGLVPVWVGLCPAFSAAWPPNGALSARS